MLWAFISFKPKCIFAWFLCTIRRVGCRLLTIPIVGGPVPPHAATRSGPQAKANNLEDVDEQRKYIEQLPNKVRSVLPVMVRCSTVAAGPPR